MVKESTFMHMQYTNIAILQTAITTEKQKILRKTIEVLLQGEGCFSFLPW